MKWYDWVKKEREAENWDNVIIKHERWTCVIREYTQDIKYLLTYKTLAH